MKTQKWIKLSVLALLSGVMFISCQKEEVLVPQSSQEFTVRPDFATLDTRPQEVIAQFTLTADDAVAVKVNESAAKSKIALVIGISDYDGTVNDLTYCDDDAIDWGERLETEGYSVTYLIDRDATASAITSALSTLASQSTSGNEIAFVYSGHGSSGNIISSDLNYISSSYFATTFSNSTSTKMMFTYDACQIGAMKTALAAAGRVVIVGSDTRRYTYDGTAAMANGVFTYYQMEGFDVMGFDYLEDDTDYAITEFKAWASAVHVKVAPSYSDLYAGDFDL
jgi:glycosylphosphatidylinositol transamidase (GPIT) subunit GPI8